MNDTNSTKYTEGDRLHWEVEKLQTEITALRRPWIAQPASWLALATVVLALGGFGIQWQHSNNELDLATIAAAQAKLDVARAQQDWQELQLKITAERSVLAQVHFSRQDEEARALGLRTRFERLLIKKSGTWTTADLQDILQSLASLDSSRALASASLQQSSASLDALSASVSARDAPPAFAVVATQVTLEQAKSNADRLQNTGLPYRIEIYRRDSTRFALTLGGPLTSTEAQLRVDYARSKGFAKDAYVRLARDWGKNLRD